MHENVSISNISFATSSNVAILTQRFLAHACLTQALKLGPTFVKCSLAPISDRLSNPRATPTNPRASCLLWLWGFLFFLCARKASKKIQISARDLFAFCKPLLLFLSCFLSCLFFSSLLLLLLLLVLLPFTFLVLVPHIVHISLCHSPIRTLSPSSFWISSFLPSPFDITPAHNNQPWLVSC